MRKKLKRITIKTEEDRYKHLSKKALNTLSKTMKLSTTSMKQNILETRINWIKENETKLKEYNCFEQLYTKTYNCYKGIIGNSRNFYEEFNNKQKNQTLESAMTYIN